MATEEELLSRITIAPDVLVGKPVIRGTRISVDQVLRVLGAGSSLDELLRDYPHITAEDVRACLLFASRALEDVTWTPPLAV